MACQVVDFSVSQTTGFTLAYMESITPVKRNRTVILGHEEEPFQKACMDLLELVTPEGPTHQEKIDAMYCQYPKVHKWLDWWTTANVTSKTFRARKPRQEDSADGLPDTTNGQESMHRLYYMIRGRLECSNEGGLDLLQDQGAKGHLPINGKRNHQAPSDGRPPDTLDALAEVPGKKAKLGWPVNSTNFDKNQFSTYPLYCAIHKNPQQRNRCWMEAGLEALYALFSPLWLCGINGRGQDLFSFLVITSTPEQLTDSLSRERLWQTTGVGTVSGIICKACSIAKPPVPSKSQTKKPCLKKINSDISVVQDPAPSDQSLHQLYETSLLTFDNSPPPLHLYFYMDISTLHTRGPTSEFYHTQRQPNSDRSEFMDTTNWPLKLTVGGAEYTLMSRGYWNGIHYWCKVYRTHEGITGVWLHNNADNAGWARFIHHNPSTIAGPSEDKYVTTAIKKISANHLDPPGELSVNLMNQLRCQPSESRGHPLQADVHNNKQAAENKQFTLLESDLANLDQEETLTQSAIISQTPNTCPKRTRLPSGSHLLDHDGKEQAPSQAGITTTTPKIVSPTQKTRQNVSCPPNFAGFQPSM
ncbi:hypothetical protein PSTG_17104 [Puccinia striiformis f. sp. tritici PST-78]|uniref:Uncharacterized protein n=1 Tax=Puccinia striiformis f. sp. tritici PST-78 TaxID=1165861 RepID=A0A0L0UR43_9BASI|nr:hypothetical protein PSTG_17104 [Puccinia striiformis f. sp. tritici PST-78]